MLRGIDLRCVPGELIGVLGPNGAGKSTLLRALAGLVPPTSGSVCLDGRPLTRWSRRRLAQQVVYAPQAEDAIPGYEVESFVGMGRFARLGRFQDPGEQDRSAVERALDRVDAGHLCGRRLDRLSGGERQRVRIARLLAAEAPILLLDEPTTGLDARHQFDLLPALGDEAARGRVVMLALHDLALAHRHCDRLVVLDAGRIVGDGPAGSTLDPALVERVFGVGARISDGALVLEAGPSRRAP